MQRGAPAGRGPAPRHMARRARIHRSICRRPPGPLHQRVPARYSLDPKGHREFHRDPSIATRCARPADRADRALKANVDAFTKFEHEGWNRVADKYDATWASSTRQFIDPLLDAAGVATGMSILDVGCGPGYVSAAA